MGYAVGLVAPLLLLLPPTIPGQELTATPELTGMSSAGLASITTALDNLVNDGVLPGAAFTIWR